eukprot:scaffold1593_cov231-Chaetoceros_neogracile.AAC.5
MEAFTSVARWDLEYVERTTMKYGESDASTDRGLSISSESLWDWEAAGESMICDQQIFLCCCVV